MCYYLLTQKSVLNIHWNDWCWSWNSNTLATWREEQIHLKRPWCWERLKAGEEGDNRGWDGWMASPTRWTWVRGLRGQGSLTCCSPWSHEESDTTEWWKWTSYSLCVCGKKIQKNPWTIKVYLTSNSNTVCCLVAKSCSTLLWPHKL